MKSAYELAMERLDADGIGRPNEGALTESQRQAVAEHRRKAEADLAQLEILHQKTLVETVDPVERARADEEYLIDRRRIEERRDRAIDRTRRPADDADGTQS